MAKGVKTGGRNFQPGNSGNVSGRPAMPEDLKQTRKLNQVTFERLANRLLHLPREELEQRANDSRATAVEAVVMNVMLRAIQEGDERRMETILNRLIGKPLERVSLEVPPRPVAVYLNKDGTASVNGEAIDPNKLHLSGQVKPTVIQRYNGSVVVLGHSVKAAEPEDG